MKIGIITSGTVSAQESKIHGLGLAPLMDTVLNSEREGVLKPDAVIVERALTRLGVDGRLRGSLVIILIRTSEG